MGGSDSFQRQEQGKRMIVAFHTKKGFTWSILHSYMYIVYILKFIIGVELYVFPKQVI